jgi:hypothetical protein
MTIAAERLAVIAAVTLPITALSSIFGMNVIVHDRTAVGQLLVILGLMLIMSGMLLAWTKRKGWWMGRASRTKQQRRIRAALDQQTATDGPGGVETADAGPGEWVAAVSARQCVRLLGECARPHPCLLTVMVNAIDQYLVDVAAL